MSLHTDLDSSLLALVQEEKLSSESIWQSTTDVDGDITVLLITDSASEQAKRMIEIGLAGGQGRSLLFQKSNGNWALKSTGYWIA